MSRSCEEDPAFDYILTLFVDATAEPLTILPTHRIVRGLGDDGAATLLDRLEELLEVERDVDPAVLRDRFEAAGLARGGDGRFGLWTRAGGAFLTARREEFATLLPDGGAALRSLDVTLLGTALERLAGVDGEAVAAGAIEYTKSAAAAIERIEAGLDGADAAFLLEPTPVAAVIVPTSAPRSSTTYRLQVPFGSTPLNAARVSVPHGVPIPPGLRYGPAGAGAANGS